jgi:hypothetical protein
MWAIAPRCDSSGLSTLSQIHSGNTGAAGPARPISKLRPRDGACATFKIYLKFLSPMGDDEEVEIVFRPPPAKPATEAETGLIRVRLASAAARSAAASRADHRGIARGLSRAPQAPDTELGLPRTQPAARCHVDGAV